MTAKDVPIKTLFKRSVTRHLKRIVKLMAAIENSRRKSTKKSVDRVHDLRTETRRADVGLRIFVEWLPNQMVHKLRKTLSDLRARAGKVRDLDVLIESLKDTHQHLSDAARKWLTHRAAVNRFDAMRPLQRLCHKTSHHGFEGGVQSLSHRFGWRGSTAELNVNEFAQGAVRQRCQKMFSKANLLKTDDKQMHKVRIRSRQLRYTFDSLAEVLAKSPAHQATKSLTEIQEELGKANDELFALEFLKTVVPECDEATIAAELKQTVQVLETRTTDPIRAVILSALERIEGLRDVLVKNERMRN